MKRIEAIIRPSKIVEVCAALAKAGHTGMTISMVEGRGEQKGWIHHTRGLINTVRSFMRAKVEVMVKDEEAGRVIDAIREAAVTGEVGDGRIFVHDMADAVKIRTNERGSAAL